MKLNPKQLERAMKKMGVRSEDIPAEEVIIRTAEKDIVISTPHVSKVNMMGQETFQIMGAVSERSREKYSKEDVHTVAAQAGVSEETAQKALEETNGDLAEAILKLKRPE